MTDPRDSGPDDRIASLKQQGVLAFDEAAIRLVEELLDRAAQCGSPALASHLEQRAQLHLGRLEAAFSSARHRAEQTLCELMAHPELAPHKEALSVAVQTGAFDRVQRAARVLSTALTSRPREPLARQRIRLQARARQRGIARDASAQLDDLFEDSRRLAASLYRHSAASARARRIVARATASISADAGHYNAHRVAARLLSALSAHPTYLNAQLARLEALALLEPLAPTKAKPARSKSPGRKERRRT